MNKQMNKQMNEQMNDRTNKQTNKRTAAAQKLSFVDHITDGQTDVAFYHCAQYCTPTYTVGPTHTRHHSLG